MKPMHPSLFDDLLQEWQQLLNNWASSGLISRATQEALLLEGEPEQLRDLVSEWIEGDFSNLQPVVLLPAGDMPGAAGVYAISTRTIYLNQDWLQAARREQALTVLTEELGNQADGLLNSSDTPGDEAELAAATLRRSSCGVFGNSAALAALQPECTGDMCGHSPSKGDSSGDQPQRGLARDRPVRPGASTLFNHQFTQSARSHRIQAPAACLAGTASSARAIGPTNSRRSATRASPPTGIQHLPTG
jgi:hypothetical protein